LNAIARKPSEEASARFATIIDFERARDSMREITTLINAGLVHAPAVNVLALEDAVRAHQLIETGHVRGKLVLKIAELDP
jgi:NADPH:quinone reductase-like Zn-dependent oxidoreductase